MHSVCQNCCLSEFDYNVTCIIIVQSRVVEQTRGEKSLHIFCILHDTGSDE